MKGMHYGKGMDYGKKSMGSMSNTKSGAKQVKAGKGTIRTPFSRAIIRDVGRRR